jgi:hypothetical protein
MKWNDFKLPGGFYGSTFGTLRFAGPLEEKQGKEKSRFRRINLKL